MKRKVYAVIAMSIAGVIALSSPAYAANAEGTTPREEADYLDALLEHAGEPAPFRAEPPHESPNVSSFGFVPSPYNCQLYPSRVHNRTKSGEKRNVGAKPYTKCDRSVPTIKQWSTLYIVEWAGTYYRPMVKDRYATNHKQKKLEQQNLQYFCKNKHNSLFQQTTRGEITIKTRYYSTVSTRREALPCGY